MPNSCKPANKSSNQRKNNSNLHEMNGLELIATAAWTDIDCERPGTEGDFPSDATRVRFSARRDAVDDGVPRGGDGAFSSVVSSVASSSSNGL